VLRGRWDYKELGVVRLEVSGDGVCSGVVETSFEDPSFWGKGASCRPSGENIAGLYLSLLPLHEPLFGVVIKDHKISSNHDHKR
jgi:hypothetical protein